MRRPFATWILPFVLLPGGFALAQDAGTDAAAVPMPQPERLPDIELLAHVTAKSIEFHEAPQVDVTFPGTPGRINVWSTLRTNLPDTVEVGKVYENVEIDLVIGTTLPPQAPTDATLTRSPP